MAVPGWEKLERGLTLAEARRARAWAETVAAVVDAVNILRQLCGRCPVKGPECYSCAAKKRFLELEGRLRELLGLEEGGDP